MLNAADVVGELPTVIDYADAIVAKNMASGQMNTAEAQLVANIRSSIRRGHPQMRTGPLNGDQICLVGSGPSLAGSEQAIRDLVWSGAVLVTLNGAYQWCVEHGLRPQTQIVMDARPSNARFVSPEVPKCNYVLASQCAPETWDAVSGRPHVWIWHAVIKAEGPTSDVLDDYYGGNWVGIGGGTTVVTRALNLLRTAGYLRFHLFGIDCCLMDGAHHAVPQPENNVDAITARTVTVGVRGVEGERRFLATSWHIKQLEDVLTVMHVNGQHFQLAVHGDGMLAHVLRVLGSRDRNDLSLTQE